MNPFLVQGSSFRAGTLRPSKVVPWNCEWTLVGFFPQSDNGSKENIETPLVRHDRKQQTDRAQSFDHQTNNSSKNTSVSQRNISGMTLNAEYRLSLNIIALHTNKSLEESEFCSFVIASRSQAAVAGIEMGCIFSHSIRGITKIYALTIRCNLWLRARLSKIISWLKSCIPDRPVETYPRLSEPGPHIPIEEPPVATYLWGEEMDRYDSAMAEMSLSKGERMRRQSAPEQYTVRSTNSSMHAVGVYDGERSAFSGDSLLFL